MTEHRGTITISTEDKSGETSEMNICLCGRDPNSEDVMQNIIILIAFCQYYKMTIHGCLEDIAPGFINIFNGLQPGEAEKLNKIIGKISKSVNKSIWEPSVEDLNNFKPQGQWLH